ncbi:MAG: substrate-binding domain-containing protein [Candidatus Riflebacteria bacterium]|nr:substrate-binding domain-containing protein [Candidatus Riflebacteria bacterium]
MVVRKASLILVALVLAIALSHPTPAVAAEECAAVYGAGKERLVVATGSPNPGEYGLIKVWGEAFSKKHGVAVAWKKAAPKEAIGLLRERKVDLILVHDPDCEKMVILNGWGTGRTLIVANELVLVGPKGDPAGIARSRSVVEAFKRILVNSGPFFSRGDELGIHKREQSVWKKVGLVPKAAWYRTAGGPMAEALRQVDAASGYFLIDSTSWIAEKGAAPGLAVLYRGDLLLSNRYHALRPPAKPGSDSKLAERFVEYLVSPEAQATLATFGKDRYGEPLYVDRDHVK